MRGARLTAQYSSMGMNSRLRFHTWREALLTAVEASNQRTTLSRPRVRFDGERWELTYRYWPATLNGVA